MANKRVFGSAPRGRTAKPADVKNEAGGDAYSLEPALAVTQFAMTGTFADKFYHSAGDELTGFVKAIDEVKDSEFLAKLAVYARYKGKMKDAPVVLLARLFDIDGEKAELVFPVVVNTPKQLRNFAQIMRSGALGRKSFGTRIKRAMTKRLQGFDTGYMCARGLTGNDPSMADVIKMLHPTPQSDEQRALYGYILGKSPEEGPYSAEALPLPLKQLEAFKADPVKAPIPQRIDVMQIMGLMPNDAKKWLELVRRMSWTQVFKNLNTMARHGVFEAKGADQVVWAKLSDKESVLSSMAFPYQLLMAYRAVTGNERGWSREGPKFSLPTAVKKGLRTALDIATANTPELPGKLVIGVDSSGSMGCSITGSRGSATSAVSCVDVAGLFAACALRANPDSVVVPYDDRIHRVELIPEDSVITICDKLPTQGGGTDCSLPLQAALKEKQPPDAVIIISDMESWIDSGRYGRGTGVQSLFNQLKAKVPHAKLVCWNLQASATTQAKGEDVLNVGGFSEALWTNVQKFLVGGKLDEEKSVNAWVDEIKAMSLAPAELEAFVTACRSR